MFALTCVLLALIVVPFVVYPVWLSLRARFAPSAFESAPITPRVDFVISAHNEERDIERKLANTLALDYPHDALTIWVVSDGSNDATVERARALADPRIRVLDLPRLGKARALSTAVSDGTAEVIAFSDANSLWDRQALRALVAPLADATVGGVAGDQRYDESPRERRAESAGERRYWNFDRRLKHWQARAGNTTSATGAIYCIRRALFEAPPPDATDDFMISTAVVVTGSRLVFVPEAFATEPVAASNALEFRRKVRVTTRGLRSLWYRRALFDPRRSGQYAVQLLIHKLWRRLVWIPLAALLVSAPFALEAGGLAALVAAAALSVAALAIGGICFGALRRFRLFAIPAYVAVVNAACAVAAYNTLVGRRITQWRAPRTEAPRAERSAEPQR